MHIPSTSLCTSVLIFGDRAGARVAVNVGIDEMESYVEDTAMACAADPLLCRTLAQYDEFVPAVPVSEMTDAEIEAAIAREVSYRELQE